MKFSKSLELVLAGTIAVGSLSSVVLGQATERYLQTGSAQGDSSKSSILACKPYSPTFIPDSNGWQTIRRAQSQEEGQIVYTFFGTGEFFNMDCHRGHLQLRADYKCGKYGGSGELRLLFYLDDQSMIRSIGIDRVNVYPISVEETNLSKKTYEIDINEFYRIVSYANTKERLVKSSFLGDKAEEVSKKGVQAIAKAAGVKINLSDINDAKKLLEDILNYERDVQRQRTIQEGNRLVRGNHVYLNEINWNSYGPLDQLFDVHIIDHNLFAKANTGKMLRKVVLFEITIPLGEESIKGVIASVDLAGYTQNWLAGKRDMCNVMFSIPLDVAEEISSRGIR